MPKSITQSVCIPANHPSLLGHFPNKPIVAGVIILAKVEEVLQQWQPLQIIQGISQAKFHQPLLPEQNFTITLTEKKLHSIHFVCHHNSQKIASGILKCQART